MYTDLLSFLSAVGVRASVLPDDARRVLQGGPAQVSAEESDVGRRAQQEGHVQPAEEAVSAAFAWIFQTASGKKKTAPLHGHTECVLP